MLLAAKINYFCPLIDTVNMRFRKGDRVSFLNDTGGGTVSRVDEKGFIYVLTPDGFEIPVSEKELVISGTFDLTERERETKTEKPVSPSTGRSQNERREKPAGGFLLPRNIPADSSAEILLGFIPESSGPVFNNTIGCYLINDSPYCIFYLAGKKESGRLERISSGFVEADTKTFLKSFDQTSLSKITDIHMQILFAAGGQYIRKAPLDVMISLNLVNFSKESYFRENDYFEEKAVLFDLAGKEAAKEIFEITEDIREQKAQADRLQKPKQKETATDTMEVDLHYEGEALANSPLSPSAILALQMSRFHAAVEEAIGKNIRRLVIIHGIGQGTLKLQIRKELQEKYPGFLFQDASFREYGFGATMVHIQTDKKQ